MRAPSARTGFGCTPGARNGSSAAPGSGASSPHPASIATPEPVTIETSSTRNAVPRTEGEFTTETLSDEPANCVVTSRSIAVHAVPSTTDEERVVFEPATFDSVTATLPSPAPLSARTQARTWKAAPTPPAATGWEVAP